MGEHIYRSLGYEELFAAVKRRLDRESPGYQL